MNKINKKIIYGLGVTSIIATPVFTVLACGDSAPPKKIDLTIDMNKINSAKDLITTLNSKMNFISKNPSTVIGRLAVPEKPNPLGYPLSKSQYQEIASGVITDITFKLKYGDKSQIFTTNFNADTIIVKNNIEKMLANQTLEGGKAATLAAGERATFALSTDNKVPNFISYVASLTTTVGMNSMGYLSIPELAWNAYQHELGEWTNFVSSINDSIVYKSWLDANPSTYLAPHKSATTVDVPTQSNYGQILREDLIDPSKLNNTNPEDQEKGINFDDKNITQITGLITMAKPNQDTKMSNLAVQFTYMIQDLYDFG